MKPEQYRVITVEGEETVYKGKPTYPEILGYIGCDTLDTVTLNRRDATVMYVDDTGMIDGKPVNPKATALYHARRLPGIIHQIHGHVVIVNDKDFAA